MSPVSPTSDSQLSIMSKMHTYLVLTSLCSLWFLAPSVLSMQCKDRQYAWPVKAPHSCCDKCPPGQHMIRRSPTACDIECGLCTGDRYTDSYNVQMTCDVCRMCDKSNMEYESTCHTSRNAVCRCEAGYKCTDEACTECLRVPGTVKSSTTANLSPECHGCPKPGADLVDPDDVRADAKHNLVEILPVCAVIAVVVALLVMAFRQWIRPKNCSNSEDTPTAVLLSTEEKEACKPVQEMCGKCEQTVE
ncbi:tumor necrosis factor receptor superfamily member 5-like, partial [Syngnathoides biaculeatus]|uniref:tumor necrosis factor receptor superfamily member 5-like n=1 Tax=Syngnathoides biaculeatus TaxID=300417 RepID=UPI002ADDE09E